MTLKHIPKVSVIMSEYNTDLTCLKASIESILCQTFRDLELILVDDGGKNDLLKLVNKYGDSRIVLVNNNGNKGLVYSLNNAIVHARGEYLVRMDTDDIALPNRIEKIYSFIESHPEFAVVGSQAIEFSGSTESGVLGHAGEFTSRDIFKRKVLVHPTVIMRRSAVQAVGGYENFKRAEDLALWCKLLLNKYRIYSLPEVLLRYRVNPNDYEKRKLKYRVGEIKTRLHYYPHMNANLLAYVRILKSVISGILPTAIVRTYRSRFILHRTPLLVGGDDA